MIRAVLSVILTPLVLLSATVGHPMSKTIAERCVLIDLQQEKGRELLPLLDSLAEENGLVVERSHPVNLKYQRISGRRIDAEIMYTMGMGRFGAVLTLFRYDTEINAELLSTFDSFIESQIARTYKVARCVDVPEFQIPESYR